MRPLSTGFIMSLFTLSIGAFGVMFGLPLFMGYLICSSSILFFLSGFAFDAALAPAIAA
jgi:hypothetical protein